MPPDSSTDPTRLSPPCCQGNFGAPFAPGDAECPQPHAGAAEAGFGNTTSAPCPSGLACQLFTCQSDANAGTLYGGLCAPDGAPWFEAVAGQYAQLQFACTQGGAAAAGGSTTAAASGTTAAASGTTAAASGTTAAASGTEGTEATNATGL